MIAGLDREALVVTAVIAVCMSAGLVMAWEEWHWLRRRGALTAAARREMRLSLSLVPPNVAVSLAAGGAWSAIFFTAQQFAPWTLQGAWCIPAAALACDFSYYWEHRCAHRVGLLWRLYHAAHHSSPAYTAATAYRVSFFNQALAPAFYLPWVLAGFSPVLVLGFQLACFHYQSWLHTEAIGPLRFLDGWLNTPANHRVHHSTAEAHVDRNFGAVLMAWDRLFGTYAPPAVDLRYGIRGAEPPRTAWEIYARPWAASKQGASR